MVVYSNGYWDSAKEHFNTDFELWSYFNIQRGYLFSIAAQSFYPVSS
jgi:hypothetical protein